MVRTADMLHKDDSKGESGGAGEIRGYSGRSAVWKQMNKCKGQFKI